MLNKRTIRISIGIVLLILIIVSFVPNFYLRVSSDGIVNAHTTTLKSPIEGVLKFTSPVKHGELFRKKQLIGKVTNSRINKSFLHELITEKKTLESRAKTLDERIARFKELKARLSENLRNYQKYSINQFKLMITQVENKISQEKAELARAKKEYDANKVLVKSMALKKRAFESSEANYLKSQARLSELESRLSELKNSLMATESGVFLGDGHNDVPYSSQRMDQLIIKTALARTALAEAQNRIDGIQLQIENEKERLKKAECYEILSPFRSLAWRLPATEGSSVVIDSELIVLLDCSSVFLDIAVSESQFPDIKQGDKIKYRLIGESNYHTGTVFALRGSGSNLADRNLAANLNKDPRREFRIWAYAAPDDLDLKPENFFQVGRRIEVKIPRKWNIFKEIIRFFNVF